MTPVNSLQSVINPSYTKEMIHVVKADGRREPFDPNKVLSSMRRAGVPKHIENQLLHEITNNVYDNIQTWEIYQWVMESLGQTSEPYTKAQYSLKQAIMMLGPTGYPFEDYVAELLQAEGYKTLVRQILSGQCVSHEIDVIAEKDGKRIIIEVKFHNSAGARSDLQVAMYTKARFDDVKIKNKIDECWLVTNTKATIDAITYAQCMGVKVLSWNYPEGGSLRDIIERHKLYPITMLTSIPQAIKLRLLENHVVLMKSICFAPNLVNNLHLSQVEKQKLIDEANYVCKLNGQVAKSDDKAHNAFV